MHRQSKSPKILQTMMQGCNYVKKLNGATTCPLKLFYMLCLFLLAVLYIIMLKSWTLEVDYSRTPCLSADQKTRGLWERDWKANQVNVRG